MRLGLVMSGAAEKSSEIARSARAPIAAPTAKDCAPRKVRRLLAVANEIAVWSSDANQLSSVGVVATAAPVFQASMLMPVQTNE